MTQPMDPIQKHHDALTKKLDDAVAAIERLGTADAPAETLSAFVNFLQDDLLPHALAEEEHFYPAMDDLIREHGRPSATMSIDHEVINRYVVRVVKAVEDVRSAGESQRLVAVQQLRRLVRQFQAVVALHFEKEERVYLPLLLAHTPAEQAERIRWALQVKKGPSGDRA